MRTYTSPLGGWAGGYALLAGLALVVGCASSVAAQQRKYLVELGAAAGYQTFDKETVLGGSLGGVGRLGVWLPLNFSLEVEGGVASPNTKDDDQSVSVKTFGLSALYNFLIGSKSSFYLKAGVGSTKYGSDCPATATAGDPICGSSGAFLGGAGFRVGLTPTVMLRGEGAYNRNKSKSKPGSPGVSLSNFGTTLGVSVMLGSKPIPDSDADGVLDNRDRCADTPAGASVDSRGCPSDSDGDGVPDGVDRCTTTVAGAAVDVRGCSQDSDGDNIPDGLDRCPDTPAGVLVDPRGCPKDSDGDKIPDGLDRCSDTPRGATVDALGCPGDEDGDGVLDGLDRCPRTAAGATVNASGCVAGQAPSPTQPNAGQVPPAAAPPAAAPPPSRQVQPTAPGRPGAGQAPPRVQPDTVGRPVPRPNVTVPTQAPAPGKGLTAGVLPGVTFASGTARLEPSAYVALDSVARLLKANPDARIEIGAHTDNITPPADALRLTALQAEAVRDYLVVQGVAYQQLVSRGYGSTAPVNRSSTARAQAMNRRVEIRPVLAGP
jgi:outer membrane protein OmpA-like peptidoglycan-associated protein/opacity protein-like surface antigen